MYIHLLLLPIIKPKNANFLNYVSVLIFKMRKILIQPKVVALQFGFAVYICLLAFAMFNYCDHCAVTEPESLLVGSPEGKCHLDMANLGEYLA